jgi:aspartyl-tRNA(Asn)/glutamyl-tRNA(Gln) amidotransferase subunit A
MTAPWLGDACSLVEALRRRELSPTEALEGTLAATATSTLGAVCHVDEEGARAAAASADVSLPFGGVPLAVKELEAVQGWPGTYGTALLAGTTWDRTATSVRRAVDRGGVVPVLQTTSSELGLVGYTSTEVHGTTRNPWDPARTPGGSSGGSAAAVASGLVPLGTGTDGGGSIRIPAGYCGLVGLKTSFRVIPMGPPAPFEPLTQTTGVLSRSVRDTARWLDVTAGADPRDRFSLPGDRQWEAGLGASDLAGLRVAVLPDLAGAVVHPDVVAVVLEAAEQLVRAAGLRRVDASLALPDMAPAWLNPALPVMWAGLGPVWPDVRPMVTHEIAQALDLASAYDVAAAAQVDVARVAVVQAMADLFDQADLVVSAVNPDDPHAAEGPSPRAVDGTEVDAFNTGRLTMPLNLSGQPAISLPAGLSPSGLPVGLQVIAPRHADALLLDVGLLWERERPWPLVAPSARS